MLSPILCKSTFSIQPLNKKSVSIGYFLNKQISIIVLIECVLTKQKLFLDSFKWSKFICDSNYQLILDKLCTYSKRHILTEDIFYSTNAKNETVSLYTDSSNNITLSHSNLVRLKQLQNCIDSCIHTKQNQLISFQNCFDYIYLLLKHNIQDLPILCHKKEFIIPFIQNYEFELSNLRSEDICFIHELQQFQYDALSNLILFDLSQEMDKNETG